MPFFSLGSSISGVLLLAIGLLLSTDGTARRSWLAKCDRNGVASSVLEATSASLDSKTPPGWRDHLSLSLSLSLCRSSFEWGVSKRGRPVLGRPRLGSARRREQWRRESRIVVRRRRRLSGNRAASVTTWSAPCGRQSMRHKGHFGTAAANEEPRASSSLVRWSLQSLASAIHQRIAQKQKKFEERANYERTEKKITPKVATEWRP